MNSWWKVTWDHIIPKSRGGTGRKSNLWLVHFSCNKLKEDQTPEEMLAAMRAGLETGVYRRRHIWPTRREKMEQIVAHLSRCNPR